MTELIWLASAFLTGLLVSRLYLPPLVGYLCAGYALNALGFQVDDTLKHIADISIELMLFTVGLKLRLGSLLQKEVLGVGGLHLFIVTLVSMAVFFSLGGHISGGFVLGVSLAFSSTVLAVKVLEDNGELSTLYGRDVLSILILQDIVAIGLLAFANNTQPEPWALALLLLPLLRPIAHRLLSISRDKELKLLLGVSFALAGGELADSVGIAKDIGALLMGVMLSGHANAKSLGEKLWGLKETFLVAFFLQIGLSGLPSYEESLLALALLSLLPLQAIVFFALFIVVGLRARTAFVSTLALTTYSEFALITSDSVVSSGLLPPVWQAIIGLAVALSLAIAAPLNHFSHQIFSFVEPWLTRFERKLSHPDRLPTTIGAAEWLVIGMGRTGVAAYKAFNKLDTLVLGLDADPVVLQRLLADGRRVVYGDAEDAELWETLPLAKIKGVLVTLPDFQARAFAIAQLKHRAFQGSIGTISFDNTEQAELYSLGAHFVIQPFAEAGKQLVEQMFVVADARS